MKHNSFKFQLAFKAVTKMLNDRQAGQLIKGMCDYVFEGIPFESTDRKVQAAFEVIKKALDNEMRGRELGVTYGRIGGLHAMEHLRQIRKDLDKPNDEEDDMPKGA